MNNPTVSLVHNLHSVALYPNQFFNVEIDSSPDTDKRVEQVEILLQEDGILLICTSDEFVGNIRVATYGEVYGE